MFRNFWLGDNELVIRFRNGTHAVLEKYEDWCAVYEGCFEACLDYCEARWRAYQESIIG